MDPRVRARRDEVARTRGRKRLRRLVAVGVLVALVAGIGLVLRSPLVDVDAVVVHGGTRTGPATVRRAAGIPLGRAMISVDPVAARARVARLPWVSAVSVTRHWPGTVVVDVRERTPVAVVGRGRGAVLVDAGGRSLAVGRERSLPTIVAVPPAPGQSLSSTGRAVVATLVSMPAALRAQIRSARADRAGLTFVLDDGIVVRWGDGGATDAKAASLAAILAQADRPTIATIDVAVPTAAALTRKAGG